MGENIQIAVDLLRINKQFISEFQNIIQKVQKLKRDCNIAKSVGTGTAVLGTGVTIAGIIVATVATGGIALAVVAPVLGWVGFGVSMAGSTTTVGTQIADSVISSGMRKNIEALQQQLRSKLDSAPSFPSNIIRLQEAESSIPGVLANGAIAIVKNVNQGLVAMGHLKKAVDYSCKGGFLVSTCTRSAPMGKIVCTCVTKNPLLRASVVSLIATGVELYFLYKSWKEPHALEKVVQDLITKIENFNAYLEHFIHSHGSKSDLPDLSRQDYEFQIKHY